MKKTLERALKAVVVVISHVIIAVVMILGIALVDRLIRLLTGGGEMLVFGHLPLSYLFQAGDVVLVVVFTVYGVTEPIRVMGED